MKEGNKNISAPKSGMQREAHPSQLKNTDYTFAFNANTDSQVGESVNITNEPSNNLAVEFPTGYKVIHYKKDLLNNRTYYFLTNPETKKSTIGYVDDVMIEGYNSDAYQTCDNELHNGNILGAPLESIENPTPSHTYVEIINDNCLSVGEGFNFDINYPIKFSELKQEKGVTNIYWNDRLNKPRWMCLSDVSYLQDEEVDCNGVLVEATCLKTYKLLQFPEHERIKILPETVQTGGTLKMGAYEFYAAYCNLYGDEATNYSTPTNPISIFDENNNILNDETIDSFTNYSIRLKISNLDTRFKYYKVVCVETNNVNRTKSAFIAGIFPTTDDIILYTSSGSTNDDYIVTGNSSIKRRMDIYELSRVRPEYDFASGDVQSGGRKFMWGLKAKSEVNLQPVVNLFGSLLKWQSNIAKESLYKTPIATAMYKGFMRNEVQPFAIRFLYKDGGYSANFPFIARPKTRDDRQDVDTINDTNYKSIKENAPSCIEVERTERWQLYNTATSDTICEAINDTNSITVTDNVERTCIIEDAKVIEEESVTIPLIEGAKYDNLTDYINDNIDYVTDPASGEIYTKIGKYFVINDSGVAVNVTGECDSAFADSCNRISFVKDAVVLNEVDEEINTFNNKKLVDYNRSAEPTFCFPYQTSQTDGNPISDTTFINTYMGCVGGVPKQVFLRNTNFQNESCIDAVSVQNNNVTSQSGVGYFHNYYGATSKELLKGTKFAAVTDADFQDKLHKGALFFSIKKLGRSKLIFEITKNSLGTSRDTSDNISDETTLQKLRYTFYKNCSSESPIVGASSEIFNTSTGIFIELDVSTFPDTFYVAIDAPYTSESVPSVAGNCASPLVTKYRTAPPTGCFSIYTRDVQYSSVKTEWKSIHLDKIQTYTAECDFKIPKVEDCKPLPYARGKFAFWESTETYPKNKELYDSSTLKISPIDLQELTEEDKNLFKEYFVNGSSNIGTYELIPEETDFTCNTPIRHFKFPDNNISPFMSDMEVAPNSDALIFPLGIYLDPAVVRTMLQVAYNNNLITSQQYSSIEGYEILKGDNSIHKSVIANGLGYDMYKYTQKEKDYYYANYPHNDLGQDLLHYKSNEDKTLIQHPFEGTSNNKFSFLSPDLFLNRIAIPTEAVLSGFQVGTSTTTFQDVEDHPKWTILGKAARTTALALAIAEAALEVVIKTVEITSQQWFVGGISTGGSLPFGIPAIALLATAYGASGFTDVGKYRYEWLKIFDELGTAYNFASYGVSHGYHNKFIVNDLRDYPNNYLRALPLRKYMKDGRYVYRDESTGDDVSVNNFQREHSIFISTGDKDFSFTYPPQYYNYDNNKKTNTSSRTRLGLNGCESGEEIRGAVGSPYITLKNYIPDQFGGIDSVKWLTTGYSEKINKNLNCNKTADCDSCNIVILGGNVCISRFTWKRKLPIFKKNIVGTADRLPFNYGDYKNIGAPVYFCNYKTDSEFNDLIIPFPDIDSEFNFDCQTPSSKFYIKPPSKMYLFYYGIADFLVESEINCNFRYAQNSYKEFFYPQVGDIVDWTQEKNVPIKEPNRFFYNNTYSQQVSNTPYRILDRGYSKEEWERRSIQDSAVIYSEMDSTENDIADPWLIYKPLNWYEFPTKYGRLIQLKGTESDTLLGRFENQMVMFNSNDKLKTAGDRISIELGTGGIFATRPQEYMTTDLGYSGTQHSDMVNTPYGNFFVDAKRGQVFQRAGNELAVISDRTGQQPSGLRNWFREQLPFKILKKFPEADIDNKYKGLGISMGWDSRMERVFLTKKDYIPVDDPCLKYSKDIGFYTDCEGNTITCPEGFAYNDISGLCERNVLSDELCPEGFTYDSLLKTCVGNEQTVSDCDCEVSEWSEWSACLNEEQTRTRTVTLPQQGNGAACPNLTEVRSCTISVPCGGSLAASGASGYYEIPVTLGTNTGDVTFTFDSRAVPDRFIIEWNGVVVADSLFVGDGLPNTTYEDNIKNPSTLSKFIYNGTGFDSTGSTINVDYDTSDIANSTGAVGTLRSVGNVGGQIGVVANYPLPTSKASDGNVKLRFNKTAASPTVAKIIVVGTSGTAWVLTGIECP